MSKLLSIAVVSAGFSLVAPAQTLVSPKYKVETVVTGLSQPTTLAFVDPTTLLVCQKGDGKVIRVANGAIAGTALDLGVSNNSERGLLGICLDPNFASNGFVYLYYSKSSTGGDSGVDGNWTDNRIERFLYLGGTLTFSASIRVFPRDPMQTGNGANHNGGIIMIGADQKLYAVTGDLNRNRAEQNNLTQSTVASKVGGIFRLNLDGSIPTDNPFIGNANADFKPYYTYGLRNSFGMTFDPLTGRVWYTENGPSTYDEINMAVPGMNSGWNKIWGPDSRSSGNLSDLVVLPNSVYRDPEFSWASVVAPTSLVFLNSTKFLPSERNKLLVGDNNFANLYLFTLNTARDGFVLTGNLTDKVADSATERDALKFGSGWGVITDLKMGPDGYCYVSSLTQGAIRRIRPVRELYELPPQPTQ